MIFGFLLYGGKGGIGPWVRYSPLAHWTLPVVNKAGLALVRCALHSVSGGRRYAHTDAFVHRARFSDQTRCPSLARMLAWPIGTSEGIHRMHRIHRTGLCWEPLIAGRIWLGVTSHNLTALISAQRVSSRQTRTILFLVQWTLGGMGIYEEVRVPMLLGIFAGCQGHVPVASGVRGGQVVG